MDDDRAELIRQLCTRIGMIMEDANTEALLIGPVEELADKVVELAATVGRAQALIDAARALCVD